MPGERDAIVRDYHAVGAGAEATLALEGLRALRYQDLLEFDRLAELLGYSAGSNPLDHRSRRAAIACSRTSRGCPSR